MRENREIRWPPTVKVIAVGRGGKAQGRKPPMHVRRKSDGPGVPTKPPNNPSGDGAEAVEGSGPAKGNAVSETRPGRRAGVSGLSRSSRGSHR
jgi:RNA-directed DNA polymerase